jgi:hypothetical protein
MAAYKVLEFNKNSGQLVIEFAVGMAPLTVDVPIKNGLFIADTELEEYIQGFIPTWHLERVAQLNIGIPNSANLEQLAETQPEIELPTVLTPEQEQVVENAAMWQQVEFEKKVAAALIKFGVLTSDPTEIPVSSQ